ncbi:MAG: hypothetical protein KAI93_17670, partial [Desulfobacterales bacterium]|nr:hypothetical protein [Desulfobacterales bacterium]
MSAVNWCQVSVVKWLLVTGCLLLALNRRLNDLIELVEVCLRNAACGLSVRLSSKRGQKKALFCPPSSVY